MIDYQHFYDILLAAKADAWAKVLPEQLASAFAKSRHGTLPQWQMLIDSMPNFRPSRRLLNTDAVQIGSIDDLTAAENSQLKTQLKVFQPWRKGPYQLYGIDIDTEWRSDWKWNRLKNHITPLTHRLVLDVGCGNGYHCWRMLGADAKMVIGIDPLLLNVMQFQLIRKLYGEAPVYVLPMGIEELPAGLKLFDTVFSMGVLYHRRSPIDHLLELRQCLRSGGELVMETLIIDGCLGQSLVPEDRYANMRNVWFIPSIDTLINWMKRCGFENIRLVDVTVTRIEEQRTTEWMSFNSLNDFLHKDNPALTIEGLPAPKRAIIIANSA
jgi:tRNA (mo5U34)-methyltransferase